MKLINKILQQLQEIVQLAQQYINITAIIDYNVNDLHYNYNN